MPSSSPSADVVDPRTEAEAQIARALQIVVDAAPAREDEAQRDYTPDELETLFFVLGMAMVQLAKVPGGKEARVRFYARATDLLAARNRHDLLDTLEADRAKHADARSRIREAFGDDVSFEPGTAGFAMQRIFEVVEEDREQLREKLSKLAQVL